MTYGLCIPKSTYQIVRNAFQAQTSADVVVIQFEVRERWVPVPEICKSHARALPPRLARVRVKAKRPESVVAQIDKFHICWHPGHHPLFHVIVGRSRCNS